MRDITQERLKEILSYNSDTGIFTNRITRGPSAISGSVAGSVNPSGYILIQIDRKSYKAHRLAWMFTHGKFPLANIDHINGVRIDNRIVNLRSASHSENLKNQKIRATNSSGVTGIYWNNAKRKWRAYIKDLGKQVHLGLFDDKFEAICARKSAENKFGYHKNHGLTQEDRAKVLLITMFN